MDPRVDALAAIVLVVAIALAESDPDAARDVGDGVRRLLGALSDDGDRFPMVFDWLEKYEARDDRTPTAT